MSVIAYSFLEWAQILNGIFSPVLSLLLIIVYLKMYREQQQQTKAQLLPYLPQLKISGEEIETDPENLGKVGNGKNIVFENTGDVPFVATINVSLESTDHVDEVSPLFNPKTPYQQLPDSVKVYRGAAGDWRESTLFFNPDQKKKWSVNMFRSELTLRDESYRDEEWCWLRVDAELEPTLEHTESYEMHRLFRLVLGETPEINSVSFSKVRE